MTGKIGKKINSSSFAIVLIGTRLNERSKDNQRSSFRDSVVYLNKKLGTIKKPCHGAKLRLKSLVS